MSQRISERFLIWLLMALLVISGSSVFAYGQGLESEVNLSAGRSIGLGLELTGSACCFSIRQWITDTRGFELVVEASGYLLLTPRLLNKFRDDNLIDGYTGVGLALMFSLSPYTSLVSPIRGLQVLMGLEITLPLLPQLALNLEAALEYHFGRGFTTFLGSGIHFYFASAPISIEIEG